MQDLTPELFAEAVAKGASYLERDGMDFGKWSLLMVHQFGEQIRPELERIWTCAQEERQMRQVAAPSLHPSSQPSPTVVQVNRTMNKEATYRMALVSLLVAILVVQVLILIRIPALERIPVVRLHGAVQLDGPVEVETGFSPLEVNVRNVPSVEIENQPLAVQVIR